MYELSLHFTFSLKAHENLEITESIKLLFASKIVI